MRGNMFLMVAKQLSTAPDSQLDKYYRNIMKNFIETKASDEEIFEVFQTIYGSSSEASNFVKQLVNPEFTSKWLENNGS